MQPSMGLGGARLPVLVSRGSCEILYGMWHSVALTWVPFNFLMTGDRLTEVADVRLGLDAVRRCYWRCRYKFLAQ